MVVTNKTEMTSDACFKILMRTSRKDYINKSWLIIFIAAVGIPVLVIGLIQKEAIYISMGSIFLALALVYLIVTFVNIKRIPKMIRARNQDILDSGALYSYSFRENSVDVEIKTSEKKNKLKLQYSELKNITEYDEHYELRFADQFIIYVNKDGFENKRLEEFFRNNVTKRAGKKPRKIHNKMSKA